MKKGISVIIWFFSLEKAIFGQICLFFHQNFPMAAKKRKLEITEDDLIAIIQLKNNQKTAQNCPGFRQN